MTQLQNIIPISNEPVCVFRDPRRLKSLGMTDRGPLRGLGMTVLTVVFFALVFASGNQRVLAQTPSTPVAEGGKLETQGTDLLKTEDVHQVDLGTSSIFKRSMDAGPVVFLVLLTLVIFSIVTWAIAVAKWWNLKKLIGHSEAFVKSFWDSRSLNDLNGRLADYPPSPVKEVFRSGYAELVRGSQLREQALTTDLAISAAMDNIARTLQKSKAKERQTLEKYLSFLAISASASPFIGLFGTVWGIMNSFEGIARTGSASLAAVAPGISEALIATAFGLAAAIPAVIGYNIANNKIRHLLGSIDGFGADYLNIVERYLVSDRSKGGGTAGNSPLPSPRI